jgi:hypothetical protein
MAEVGSAQDATLATIGPPTQHTAKIAKSSSLPTFFIHRSPDA